MKTAGGGAGGVVRQWNTIHACKLLSDSKQFVIRSDNYLIFRNNDRKGNSREIQPSCYKVIQQERVF